MTAAFRLTARQRQVVVLLAEGLDYQQISRKLGITSRTVRMHVESVARSVPGRGPPLWRVLSNLDRLVA